MSTESLLTGSVSQGKPGFAAIAPEWTAALTGHIVASEALRYVGGAPPSHDEDSVLVLDLTAMRMQAHPVLPLPHCRVCGGAAEMSRGFPSAGHRLPDVTEDLLAALTERYVDPRTGIVRAINLRDDDGSQAVRCATAVPAPGGAATYPGRRLEVAGGKGVTVAQASVAAIAEAVERYSASIVDIRRLRRCSERDLDEPSISPRDLGLYAPHQYARKEFPFVEYDASSPVWWVRGTWLDDRSPVWVPAAASYYRMPDEVDDRLWQVTSSGLAAGTTLESAATRALLEVLERDAFALTWLAELPGHRLSPKHLREPATLAALASLHRAGATVEMVRLKAVSPVIVMAAIGFGDGQRWPGAHVGLGAHTDGEVAARRAVHELAYSGGHVRHALANGFLGTAPGLEQVRTFGDHAHYYVPVDRRNAFDFLFSDDSAPTDAAPSAPVPVERLGRERPLDEGLRCAIVDVTAPDVRLGGLHVVRALVPGLVPIHAGHGHERLASSRLAAVGGLRNRHPHPLC